MIRSLRARLSLFSALVLVATVGGFGWFIHWSVGRSLMGQLDSELEKSAAALDASLRSFTLLEVVVPPRGRPEGGKGGPGGRPSGKGKDRPPPGGPGSRVPLGSRIGTETLNRLANELRLPPKSRISPEQYFGVWLPDKSILKSDGMPEDTEFPELADGQGYFISRGENRELRIMGPGRTVILVGTPLEPVHEYMVPFDRNLMLAGSGIILLGLVGQWWISRQIFRPLKTISETAGAISAANLGARIDPSAVDLELQDLAKVLNDTFQRLEESFRRQAAFTADASHELRTPLAVLRGQAELTLSKPRESGEYVRALGVVLDSALRMNDLVEGLLALARADAGFPGMSVQRVDLADLAREALGEDPPRGGLTAHLESAPVQGDPLLLRQLLQNLVSNAQRHGKTGIWVATRSENGLGVLEVGDQGPGIPPEELPRIFERFYRVDKARSRSEAGGGGTGLGLAICKEIAVRHGGEIRCESEPGKRTVFRVTLPLADKTDPVGG